MSEHSWLNEEDSRAEKQGKKGQTLSNPDAPRLVKNSPKEKKVQRSVKGLRIRTDLQKVFDRLVFEQKQADGKTGPELADEAMKLVFDKYGLKYKD